MFSLLRKIQGRDQGTPRELARQRVESAIRRDRMEVSTPQLSELRGELLTAISARLPVASEFSEFGLDRVGDDLYLVSRVRLEDRK